ncbi:hypothetical protein MJO28_014170 [Puccinia striiformis f. sp. tritici]|uniref:Uncharacterized protein n=1 Tax=Puccinia striiformis f. sp. tritici TaxID=168172 RepID=A0ACC0DTZ9_9BASI|nr:hypothetical protein MJO28_014170 [Puccinia striiformis f. sp. tritici]
MPVPLGTLIVVVLKARNLPNKQRIGKQDPYATCTYLSHRKRTKTDKRGGQHPVWDDELRFDIYDNPKDAMASASVSTTATGGIVPVKSTAPPIGSAGSAGVKELRVAVFADDPRDPNLIGEGKVDLTETLKKGEFDDWVTVTNKGKYQGEVYLEMTFYSAKPPPEKIHTPTGPSRAGVFEASSPGSGLRPTQAVASGSPVNEKRAQSPLCMPVKKINPATVPVALRAGRPMSGPISTGHLPLPGEPSSSKDASLNSRQRSTGSLSMPAAEFGLQTRSPSRSPSRNHSLNETSHLTNSLHTLSLSGRPLPNSNIHLVQPNPSSELHAPHHPSQPRPHRHSFSGHSHLQPSDHTQHTHSASSSVHTTDQHEDHFHDHVNPSFVDPSYHDHLPQSSQPPGSQKTAFPIRRPLPVPGDSVHWPTSAWGGHSHHVPSEVHSYANEGIVSSQPPPANYGQYPDNPANGAPVMYNNGTAYPPPNLHNEGHNPPNGVHQQSMANRPQHLPYSDQPSHYPPLPPQNSHFSQPQHSGHPSYSLPPPPLGQTPVPIHEVFGVSNSGRAYSPAPSNGYPPQPQVIQSPTRANSIGESVYPYPPTHHHQDQVHQQRNQSYNPSLDSHALNNNPSYQLQNAPPPPPPHLSQQMQYQPFHVQQTTSSGMPAPSPPPPGPPSQMYHQPSYAAAPPLPSTTPAPGFTSPHPQQYPEYNNPFHNPTGPSAAVPGNVYVRPSPTPAPPSLPPPPPNGHLISHPHSFSTPFYHPNHNGYHLYPSHQS